MKHSYRFSCNYLRETWPMPPLGRPVAAARGSRIFGGFLRFLTRYWKGPDVFSRAARPGQLPVIPASRSADRCPLPTRFASRIMASRCTVGGARGTGHGSRVTVAGWRIMASRSRITDHGQPITGHGARAGMFETKGAGRGAASLTLLNAQRRPASRH